MGPQAKLGVEVLEDRAVPALLTSGFLQMLIDPSLGDDGTGSSPPPPPPPPPPPSGGGIVVIAPWLP